MNERPRRAVVGDALLSNFLLEPLCLNLFFHPRMSCASFPFAHEHTWTRVLRNKQRTVDRFSVFPIGVLHESFVFCFIEQSFAVFSQLGPYDGVRRAVEI